MTGSSSQEPRVTPAVLRLMHGDFMRKVFFSQMRTRCHAKPDAPAHLRLCGIQRGPTLFLHAPRVSAAFTLIELLVVISIIAILAAMLLPSLARAKSQGLNVACLNNLKQLETCWHLYAVDNADHLPPNDFVYDIISDTAFDEGPSWCTNVAPFDGTTAGLQNGLLWPFNSSAGIYRCPSDKSSLVAHGGVPSTGQPRVRSYNMSQSINGEPDWLFAGYIPSFTKYTAIKDPAPAALIAFLDVHEDEIIDTEFGIPTQGVSGYQSQWWDLPANRHNQGCNFSFADGHAEHWKWKIPKVETAGRGAIQSVLPGELDDYNRVEAGIKQNLD